MPKQIQTAVLEVKSEFIKGIMGMLFLLVGTAMVSRLAKAYPRLYR